MSQTELDKEKRLLNSLIAAMGGGTESPDLEKLKEGAKGMALMIGYTGILDNIINQALAIIATRVGQGTIISSSEAQHDAEWARKKKDEISWIYSNAYEDHLRQGGWPSHVVQSLSDICHKILGLLQDPTCPGMWRRRGLVIGHVQSGKTANYTGVITKAADAGYKFIIVLAGIHNNLRKQTQERIDEGFIGRSSNPKNRINIGVGLSTNYPHPVTLTNINSDFSKKTAESSGWKLNDFSKPIVLIIKKNVSTLNNLLGWLKDLNTEADSIIHDVPMLMIDDEADNAGINVNKDDLDPTKTNKLLRQILHLFDQSCYVGYTATPFANIFINKDSYDEEAYEDLFPKDFIYLLDAPTTYFGPNKIFLDESYGSKVIRTIDDAEEYIPQSHKKEFQVSELPPSLKRAYRQFVLARAIRHCRQQVHNHTSMLVNVSRFSNVQKQIRDLLSMYAKEIEDSVTANSMSPYGDSDQIMRLLRDEFENEYGHCEFSWETVKSKLINVVRDIHTPMLINSKSDEILDYKDYENHGEALVTVAVGGLSLSRGLTLEGLCISYMYRNTKMYDTLMQMGRWFGYRIGYEDLCRIWLSDDSADWYEHIAEKTEELRQQIRTMRRDKLTPEEFGLYVGTHPDNDLMVTARNKMRHAEKVTLQQSYGGRIFETYRLSKDRKINDTNCRRIETFWKTYADKSVPTEHKGVTILKDIGIEKIRDFIRQFDVHEKLKLGQQTVLKYLEKIEDDFPTGDVMLISIGNDADPAKFKLGSQERTPIKMDEDATYWQLRKSRVAGREFEKYGLNQEQQQKAKAEADRIRKEEGKNPTDNVPDVRYREIRNKPLLMLHRLRLITEDKQPLMENIAAFGISFPFGDAITTVEVVANKVMIQQIFNFNESSDTPENEDDYDE